MIGIDSIVRCNGVPACPAVAGIKKSVLSDGAGTLAGPGIAIPGLGVWSSGPGIRRRTESRPRRGGGADLPQR